MFTEFYGVLESPLSENRKLPLEFASPTTTIVYGNKIGIVVWTEIIRIILITNNNLAKAYNKYFEIMWNNLPAKKK